MPDTKSEACVCVRARVLMRVCRTAELELQAGTYTPEGPHLRDSPLEENS